MRLGNAPTQAQTDPKPFVLTSVIVYYVAFYVGWLLVRTFLDVSSQTIAWGLTTAVAKIIIWDLPVILYVKRIEKLEWITFLKLNNKIERWRWLVVSVVLLMVYLVVVNNVLLHQPFLHIKPGFSEWLNAVIVAGMAEELLFRGFFLKKLAARLKFWKANIVTTVMFLLVHYPLWLSLHHSAMSLVLNSAYIVIFSLAAGYVWKKTNSLWGSVLFHTFNNIFVDIGL